MKIIYFIFIFATGFAAQAQSPMAPRQDEYERCFLGSLQRSHQIDGYAMIAIRQSCSRMLSTDITGQVRHLIENARIAEGRLSLKNQSSYHITEICLLIRNRRTGAGNEFCFSDFVSDSLAWVGNNPSEIHKIAMNFVTIQPRQTMTIEVGRIVGIAGANFWDLHSWQFTSFRGF
jgi:hypothetical protein